jgi:hypothetical protein
MGILATASTAASSQTFRGGPCTRRAAGRGAVGKGDRGTCVTAVETRAPDCASRRFESRGVGAEVPGGYAAAVF